MTATRYWARSVTSSPRSPGARDQASPRRGDLDGYENLVLLCPTDHKLVDDQPAAFPPARLREVKREHETWVSTTLDEPKKPGQIQSRWIVPQNLNVTLVKATTGAQLLELMSRTLAYHFHETEPSDECELELQANLLQDLADFGDIYDDIGTANQMREKFQMTNRIAELKRAGFEVYVGEYRRILEINGTRSTFPTAIVRIVHERDTALTEEQPG